MVVSPARRVARSGVLVLGGGVAGRHVASELGEHGATVVEPVPGLLSGVSPAVEVVAAVAVALDAERRVVHVETGTGRVAIAYAQLVVALGRFAAGVASLGLPADASGRVRVDERLRVPGAPNIYALGDCAALPQGAPHASAPAALAAFYA